MLLEQLKYLSIALRHLLNPQVLNRVPEPTQVLNTEESVLEYDQVMASRLVLVYAAIIQLMHKVLPVENRMKALDLASGPGHATLMLKHYLKFQQVTGVDLAQKMIHTSSKNAEKQAVSGSVNFALGDITKLTNFSDNSVQLSTCMDAAHHLPTLNHVTKLLQQMDRVTEHNGTCVLMDLIRPKTEGIARDFVQVVGRDYKERGFDQFYTDFENSVYAAWTVSEMIGAVPQSEKRKWLSISPLGFPVAQMILGIPKDRKNLFLHNQSPWTKNECPVPKDFLQEYKLLQLSLRMATIKKINQTR